MKNLLLILLAVPILFFVVASTTFQFRNPTANEAATLTEFGSVITFKKLNKYQGNGNN